MELMEAGEYEEKRANEERYKVAKKEAKLAVEILKYVRNNWRK